MNFLNGYKSYIGGAIVALASVINYMGHPEIGILVRELGLALGFIGIAHKVQKAG